MIITTARILPITVYRIRDGKECREIIFTKLGKHNYPDVDHKDPRVAEQLRIMRKHGRISFDEMLDSDSKIYDTLKGTPEEKAAALKAATSVRSNGSVSVPIPKDPGSDSPNRAASTKKAVNHGFDPRPSEHARTDTGTEPVDSEYQGGRPISRKGKHESR